MSLLRATTTLFALLLLPAVAAAQDYAVTGPSLSGRVTIDRQLSISDQAQEDEPERPQMILVAVSGTWTQAARLKRNYETRTVSGARGTIHGDGTLTFSYEVSKPGNAWHGITGFFGNPLGLGRRSEADRTETITVTMRPDGEGNLTGEVEGLTHTWKLQDVPDDVVVLAIPGLSTNNWNRVGIPYLDENLAALEARGIEARRLEISTESAVRTNALFISREILREAVRGKRVIVMAHSKGATDTTAALALYPYLIPHVAGVIAIQPVYGGSPVAEMVADSRALTGTVRVVFRQVFKGSEDAVLDLVPANREAFVREHPYPADKVPTVVIRSYFDRPNVQGFTVLSANEKIITRRLGERNDGMVTLAGQVIPGAVETIDFDDLDHFEPGVRAHSKYSPTDVTNAAVDAILKYVK